MELVASIHMDELEDGSDPDVRYAARAVLQDDEGKIPVLYVAKHKYHKLPGGGVEEGEDKKMALVRECLEEVGAEVEIKEEVGYVEEYRKEWIFKQISYCYYGRIISKGDVSYTQEEIDNGFTLKWLDYDEAVNALENDDPTDYQGQFVRLRDLALLKASGKYCGSVG